MDDVCWILTTRVILFLVTFCSFGESETTLLLFPIQSVNGAHRDWILDMCMLPDNDVLISCCRTGRVKLWSSDTCNPLDEVRAHSSAVNSMAINSSHLFTASR